MQTIIVAAGLISLAEHDNTSVLSQLWHKSGHAKTTNSLTPTSWTKKEAEK